MKTSFTRVLSREKVVPPPIWMMRQAGRYLPEYRLLRKKTPDFLSFCLNPTLTVEAALQPMRRFALDAAIVFSDILLVPYAMGLSVVFDEKRGPLLSPVDRKFRFPKEKDVLQKLQIVGESISILRKKMDEEIDEKIDEKSFSKASLIGFCGAPWTLAAYMVEGMGSRDFFSLRRLALEEKGFFQDLIAYLTSLLSNFLALQVRAGADMVQIFDTWAGLADVEQFYEWIIAPTKTLVDNLRGTFVMGFAKQAGNRLLAYANETGLDGVSLDSGCDLSLANEQLPRDLVLQGNLDPVRLLVGGEDMEAKAKDICERCRHRPFIFNLGHGILKDTPPEHVARLVKTVREFR